MEIPFATEPFSPIGLLRERIDLSYPHTAGIIHDSNWKVVIAKKQTYETWIINFDKTETNKHKVFDKTEMNNEVLFDKTETNLDQYFMTLNLRVYQLKYK